MEEWRGMDATLLMLMCVKLLAWGFVGAGVYLYTNSLPLALSAIAAVWIMSPEPHL